jgi:hypothetical protein
MGNFIMSALFLTCLVVIFMTTCNCLEHCFREEDLDEEDHSVFKYALILLIVVLLSNALWFGLVQEIA